MKKFMLIMAALLSLAACKSRKPLLPNVSGKAGEVVILMDKAGWDGALGEEVRGTMGADCPYFVMPEPLYTLINVAPVNFTDLFKVHRNIVYFKTDTTVTEGKFSIHRDVWAQPQFVAQISARTREQALEVYRSNSKTLIANLEQAERERVISGARQYQEKGVAPKVAVVFGGSPAIPGGYTLRKITDDFAWIEYSRQSSTQAIFIYKYPVEENPFELENIVRHRDEIMKNNVPGPRDGSYVVTSREVVQPNVEYIKYRGREFAQTRGWWEVQGDFMGGPFVSESFYSRDGKEIICTEAFVYYPKDKKRLYLRQVESLLYSWEWSEGDDEK